VSGPADTPEVHAIAATLIEALPFMRRYQDAVMVIKYGGHAMGEEETARLFARDIVLAAMLALAIRQFRVATGIQRIPALLLLLGSACGVGLAVVVLVMDVAHVAGQLELMRTFGEAYGPLSLLTFLFLCAGFAGQPVVRSLRERTRRSQIAQITRELEPLWQRATSVRPGLSGTDALGASLDDPEGRLHREVVEIRDAMIDPRVTFEVTPAEEALLERAEAQLLGLDSGVARIGLRADRGDNSREHA